jgi:hypothetical protein
MGWCTTRVVGLALSLADCPTPSETELDNEASSQACRSPHHMPDPIPSLSHICIGT